MINYNARALSFSFLIAIILCLAAWIAQQNIENKLSDDIGNSLNTVLNTTRQAINSWALKEKNDAIIWANSHETRLAANKLLHLQQNRQALLQSITQKEFRTWLAPIIRSKGYQGFFIISPDSISLASSRDENIGTRNLLSKQPSFLNMIWAGKTALSTPLISDTQLPDEHGVLQNGLPTMFVGAPVFDDTKKVIAAFVFRINPDSTFTSVLQQGRIGTSGETYAFNRKGLMISLSRFNNQLRQTGLIKENQRGILNIRITDPGKNLLQSPKGNTQNPDQPLTYMAQQALTGKPGLNTTGYRDYRGVPVLGAWVWDNELQFGIATEIDVAEAYEPILYIRNTFLAFISTSILLLALLTIIFIHNRKQLARNEKELRLIVNQAPVPMVLTDTQGYIKFFNRKFINTFGWTTNDVRTPEQWFEAAYPDQEYRQKVQTSWEKAVNKAVTNNTEIETQHWRLTCKNGDIKDTDFTMTPVSNNYNVISLVDLTERIKSAAALKLERDKANNYLETVETIIVALDINGNITLINRKGCEILGYDEDELTGKNWLTTCIPEKDYAYIFNEVFPKIIAGGIGDTEYVENEIITRHGELRLIAWHNNVVTDKDGNISGTLSAGQDITELRKSENEMKILQKQLVQSQKMEVINLLSGGFAHNFNNMLNSIIGYSSLAKARATKLKDQKLITFLDNVIDSGQHAANLVQQILSYSANKTIQLMPQLLHEFISASTETLKTSVSSKVNIETELETIDSTVMIDTTELLQALINLCINASEAMDGAGIIQIHLHTQPETDNECHSCFNKITGTNAVITIKDSGHGIETNNLANLFAPFFTTKELYKGAGIGLSMVHAIIHKHNGHIQIESAPGTGTSIRLYLPLCRVNN